MELQGETSAAGGSVLNSCHRQRVFVVTGGRHLLRGTRTPVSPVTPVTPAVSQRTLAGEDSVAIVVSWVYNDHLACLTQLEKRHNTYTVTSVI